MMSDMMNLLHRNICFFIICFYFFCSVVTVTEAVHAPEDNNGSGNRQVTNEGRRSLHVHKEPGDQEKKDELEVELLQLKYSRNEDGGFSSLRDYSKDAVHGFASNGLEEEITQVQPIDTPLHALKWDSAGDLNSHLYDTSTSRTLEDLNLQNRLSELQLRNYLEDRYKTAADTRFRDRSDNGMLPVTSVYDADDSTLFPYASVTEPYTVLDKNKKGSGKTNVDEDDEKEDDNDDDDDDDDDDDEDDDDEEDGDDVDDDDDESDGDDNDDDDDDDDESTNESDDGDDKSEDDQEDDSIESTEGIIKENKGVKSVNPRNDNRTIQDTRYVNSQKILPKQENTNQRSKSDISELSTDFVGNVEHGKKWKPRDQTSTADAEPPVLEIRAVVLGSTSTHFSSQHANKKTILRNVSSDSTDKDSSSQEVKQDELTEARSVEQDDLPEVGKEEENVRELEKEDKLVDSMSSKADEDLLELMVRIAENPSEWQQVHKILRQLDNDLVMSRNALHKLDSLQSARLRVEKEREIYSSKLTKEGRKDQHEEKKKKKKKAKKQKSKFETNQSSNSKVVDAGSTKEESLKESDKFDNWNDKGQISTKLPSAVLLKEHEKESTLQGHSTTMLLEHKVQSGEKSDRMNSATEFMSRQPSEKHPFHTSESSYKEHTNTLINSIKTKNLDENNNFKFKWTSGNWFDDSNKPSESFHIKQNTFSDKNKIGAVNSLSLKQSADAARIENSLFQKNSFPEYNKNQLVINETNPIEQRRYYSVDPVYNSPNSGWPHFSLESLKHGNLAGNMKTIPEIPVEQYLAEYRDNIGDNRQNNYLDSPSHKTEVSNTYNSDYYDNNTEKNNILLDNIQNWRNSPLDSSENKERNMFTNNWSQTQRPPQEPISAIDSAIAQHLKEASNNKQWPLFTYHRVTSSPQTLEQQQQKEAQQKARHRNAYIAVSVVAPPGKNRGLNKHNKNRTNYSANSTQSEPKPSPLPDKIDELLSLRSEKKEEPVPDLLEEQLVDLAVGEHRQTEEKETIPWSHARHLDKIQEQMKTISAMGDKLQYHGLEKERLLQILRDGGGKSSLRFFRAQRNIEITTSSPVSSHSTSHPQAA